MARNTFIRFFLDVNDLDELECFICDGKRCELSFVVRGGGKAVVHGVHDGCAQDHNDRVPTKPNKVGDN